MGSHPPSLWLDGEGSRVCAHCHCLLPSQLLPSPPSYPFPEFSAKSSKGSNSHWNPAVWPWEPLLDPSSAGRGLSKHPAYSLLLKQYGPSSNTSSWALCWELGRQGLNMIMTQISKGSGSSETNLTHPDGTRKSSWEPCHTGLWEEVRGSAEKKMGESCPGRRKP